MRPRRERGWNKSKKREERGKVSMRGEGDAGKRGEKVRLKRNEDPEEGENRR